MMPVYFLSILLNGLTGGILAFGKEEAEGGGFSFSLHNETLRLGIGALTFITGFLKILSPVNVGGNIPVAGDLVPALAGLAGGFILAFEFYRRRNTMDSPAVERIEGLIRKSRKSLGFFCIAAAALHWIFYSVLFL